MEKPIYEPWKYSFPPETPKESMEFLSRSWSVSAQEVSKALSPSQLTFPKMLGGVSFTGDSIVEESTSELDDSTNSLPTVSGNPFSFATTETSQMVMDRIMSQSQEVSPRTSGRLSHSSGPLNGSLTESPPVSPTYLDPVKNRAAVNHLRATPTITGGSCTHTAVVPTGRTMGRWLKDRKEKKKEETRAHNAQIHASISVAGVAAAVAAMAAATAAASATSKDEQTMKSTMAVASAATLVAAQCVEAAEALGADREHLASVVSSAVNVRSAGDVMTLTAAAATALRGAATLKARGLKDVWNIAAVIPVDRNGGTASNGSSNGSLSGELQAEENFLGACSRELLARGCELLKRTRKGDLHWKVVSVYINRENQVTLKMKSRHIAGTVTKKKKNVVLEVVKNMPAWPGRYLLAGGENRRYFGLKTASRGVVEFECMNQREYEIWTGGVSRLLEIADTRKRRT